MFGFSMATQPPRREEDVGGSSRQDMTSRRYKKKLEDCMKHVLNDSERGTVKYYIHEYSKGRIDINGFVVALKELLNTRAKMSLLKEIKPLISPHDVMKYEALILEYQIYPQSSTNHRKSKVQSNYADHEDTSDFSLESVLSAASSNDESTNQNSRNTHSTNQIVSEPAADQISRPQSSLSSIHSKPKFVTDGSNRSITTEVTHSNSIRRKLSIEEMNHTYQKQEMGHAYHIDINHGTSSDSKLSSNVRHEDSPRTAGVPTMGMRSKINKTEYRNPSDDSGVSGIDVKIRTKLHPLTTSGSGGSVGDSQLTHVQNFSDDSSSDDSPRKQSYRVSRRLENDSDTETRSDFYSDHEIPREHNSQHSDSEYDGGVVLKSQKHVGTLPRYKDSPDGRYEINQLFNSGSGNQPSFGQQLKSRQILSGKLYSQSQSAQSDHTEQSQLEDYGSPSVISDYDTADILTISQQIMSENLRTKIQEDEESSLPEYPNQQPNITQDRSNTPSPTPSFPPPPLSQTVTPTTQRKDSNTLAGVHTHTDTSPTSKSSKCNSITDNNIYESIQDGSDWGASSHSEDNSSEIENRPIPASSPTIEKRIRGKPKSDIYAVVKKHRENTSRRSVIEIHNNQQTTQLTDTNQQVDPTEELIQVNKIKATLGLAIEGGSGTKQPIPRIINIQETGCAYTSNLKVGHVIRRINDKSLEGLTHIQAARCIADAFRDRSSGYMEFLVSYQPEKAGKTFREKMEDFK